MPSFILSIILLLSLNSYSQQEVYSLAAVDEAPFIKACYAPNKDTKECFNQNMRDFFRSRLVTPKTVQTEGKAYVQFIISETGKIRNIQVRATEQDQKEEIIRVVSSLKVAKPAVVNGKQVALKYSMPVIFRRTMFESYSDFFGSRAKGLPLALESAYPPLYEECMAQSDKSFCFKETTENYIANGIKKAKNGAVLNFYFEIDKNGEVKNVMVMSHNDNGARLQAAALLRKLQVKDPARNEAKHPVHSYYFGKLIL